MQIVLTHTTLMIDMPDQCAAGSQATPRPADNRPAKVENPFLTIADWLDNMQPAPKSGRDRDEKPATPPWRADYGTTLT